MSPENQYLRADTQIWQRESEKQAAGKMNTYLRKIFYGITGI